MKPRAWALRHPIPVIIIMSAAVLFGIVALLYSSREFAPPVMAPAATVVTQRSGVVAEDIEEDISSVLESHFSSIPGLKELSSESREGVSIITLKFAKKANNILQELETRIDSALGELPDDLDSAPTVFTRGPTISLCLLLPYRVHGIPIALPDLWRRVLLREYTRWMESPVQ